MMFPGKRPGQGTEVWLFRTSAAVNPAIEVSDGQEGNDQVVESLQAFLFDGEAPVAVRCIPALHLDADLRLLLIAF
jgi:hypothetical protein